MNGNVPPTRVVFVHGALGMGGAEVLRVSVLAELVKNPRFELRVCTLRQPGPLAARVEELGIPVDCLGNRGGLFDWRGVQRLQGYLQHHLPDVVQASQFVTNTHTVIAARRAGCRAIIIEEHGIYTWKRWYHRLLDKLINNRANGVIACSHRVAESASRHLSRSVDDICVIHNCASSEHFAPVRGAAKASQVELLGGEHSFVLCVVGTLRWEKGHHYLFDAWQVLMEQKKLPADAMLAVVGDGPLKSELESRAKTLPGVRMLGGRSDVRGILEGADLFVLPSVNEGFGIAIVEAMCAGLPVVSTTSGGVPEVIDDGETGLLVPPGNAKALADAIALLANDPPLREKLGSAARGAAEERFSPQMYCQKLTQLYDELLRTE